MSLFLALVSFWSINSARAANPADCPDLVERKGNLQIQQVWSEDTKACFFTTHPRDSFNTLVYRDYLFSSQGLMMVFNSYGPGEESEKTAAREFFFFPRPLQNFTYSWNESTGEFELTHISGDVFYFDIETANLKRISRGQLQQAPVVDPSNRGGIEILNYPGLLMDGGFRVGGAPTANPRGSSLFTDRFNVKCQVKNSGIFNYKNNGNLFFRYTDDELKTYLQTVCPKINF